MNPIIIDGKETSRKVLHNLRTDIAQLTQHGHTPGLAVVLVGEDPASRVYVDSKVKACEELGIYSQKWVLSTETTQKELVQLIHQLNTESPPRTY